MHRVKSLNVLEIKKLKSDSGKDFFVRKLLIKNDETEVCITLFSDSEKELMLK